MSNNWSRLKQLIIAQSMNVKETDHSVEEESDKQVEEVEDLEDNDDESESVDDEVKYTETEELDESQYDEETKLIVEGMHNMKNQCNKNNTTIPYVYHSSQIYSLLYFYQKNKMTNILSFFAIYLFFKYNFKYTK